MGLAARLAASTPIVLPPADTSAAPVPSPVQAVPVASSAAMAAGPPSYDQSTTQDPFRDSAGSTSYQSTLGDQKVSPLQQAPVTQYASSGSSFQPPQRQNSIVSTAPSSSSGSVKRKPSLFRNPFRRDSAQSAGPSSTTYGSSQQQQQQQRPLSTSYPGQAQNYAPPPGMPPQTTKPTQRAIDSSIPKTGDFRLSEAQVLSILEYTVQDQGIGAFYDHRALQRIAGEVSRSSALNALAVSWSLPRELAADLCKIALFDVVLLVDDSGSMAFEEEGSRIDDAKLIVERCALAASLFDDDGIQVRFLNSNIEGNDIRNSAGAMDLISRVRFSGLTPLGTAMEQKILNPLVVRPAKANRLAKPVLVIAVTDGTPQGEPRDKILRVIMQASKELERTRYGPDALSISFAQIGNDTKAQEFLASIDVHPTVGDLVDCTSNYELEADEMMKTSGIELSPSMWIMKVLMGGIDSSYDAVDE